MLSPNEEHHLGRAALSGLGTVVLSFAPRVAAGAATLGSGVQPLQGWVLGAAHGVC